MMSTDRKKRRIEEEEKQACTIFVGDLNPETSAKQLTGLFKRFENQRELLLRV
jgi:RNA recognition motif-containing protein